MRIGPGNSVDTTEQEGRRQSKQKTVCWIHTGGFYNGCVCGWVGEKTGRLERLSQKCTKQNDRIIAAEIYWVF